MRYFANYSDNDTMHVRMTDALFELHIEINTRGVSHAFPNICKYIFETSCSKSFF